jgi:hypothetical protein
MRTINETAVFEHSFWLEVLRDHAYFIEQSLGHKEKDEIEKATSFYKSFDELLRKVKNGEDNLRITRKAIKEANSFREYKLSLIRKHLTQDFIFHLSPTFVNHMVNELEEYLRILGHLEKNEMPPLYHELHHHLLWLLDAAGHAGAISDSADAVEKRIKKKSDSFTKDFEQFYIKAVELTGYLRTNLESFPALERMNKNVKIEIVLFQNFLKEIEELEIDHELLGTFSALMADHMMREENYYLTKLAQSTGE